MRPIEFRGLRKDGKGWAYGHYCKHAVIDKHLIADIETSTWNEVDPSTVGQFTGLHDREGKKIFEGDIIEISTEVDISRDLFTEPDYQNQTITCEVYYHSEIASFDLKVIEADTHLKAWCFAGDPNMQEIKIISTKFDNPELIKP